MIGPPPPPPATVTVSPRVKGLSFVTDHQEASYGCSISFSDPNYHIWSDADDPTHAQGYGYTWTGLDYRGHQHDASPTGYATATGRYAAACTLKIVANVPGALPFDVGPYSKACFAIGGPLTPGVILGSTGSLTPPADGGSYSAKYIQYLGYVFNGSAPDDYTQIPQLGSMQAGPQPDGTTYSWSIEGNGTFTFGTPPPSTSQVDISATQQSGFGSIHVKCTFNFTNPDPDDPCSGQADDDSESTPPPGSATTAPDYYHFTSHRPDTTSVVRPSPIVTTGPPLWGVDYEDQLYLYDHLNTPMPGCWVQERYPTSPPSWDTVNDINTWWTTGPGGAFGRMDDNGVWHLFPDTLAISAETAWTSVDHPNDPVLSIVQELWAGTRDTRVYPEASGVHVANYTLKYWTDQILRNLTGF
ncbi:MAG TPA: hypothetical protein VHE55_07660 [Fimbriimonadaceae bacterium]|nr:hypothetical protein [Fimbriimonadaceae bacterium]